MKRHVVLIGLPGAGKSTVGRLAGRELNAEFVDVDREIERRTGRSVAELFRERGEPGFRALERQVMTELLAGSAQVVAPGGGWAAEPGAIEDAAGRACVICLKVAPATAVARLGDAADRPLLADAPEQRLRELEVARAPFYGRADAAVETDGRSANEVAAQVAALARSLAGW